MTVCLCCLQTSVDSQGYRFTKAFPKRFYFPNTSLQKDFVWRNKKPSIRNAKKSFFLFFKIHIRRHSDVVFYSLFIFTPSTQASPSHSTNQLFRGEHRDTWLPTHEQASPTLFHQNSSHLLLLY